MSQAHTGNAQNYYDPNSRASQRSHSINFAREVDTITQQQPQGVVPNGHAGQQAPQPPQAPTNAQIHAQIVRTLQQAGIPLDSPAWHQQYQQHWNNMMYYWYR